MKKTRSKHPIVVPEACGKRRYRSERDAIGSALCCARKRGTALRVYACPKCKGWHLTKQEKRDSPAPTPTAKPGIPAALIATVRQAGHSPAPVALTAVEPAAKKARFNSMDHQVWCRCTACAWPEDSVA